MSNLCDNTFFANSSDSKNIKAVADFLNESGLFNVHYSIGENCIDARFNSDWVFPETEMNELLNSIPNRENIYMRCLSVEYGQMYHALWECRGQEWIEV